MNLSALAVRRGVTFSMAYLIVVMFGLFSLSGLHLDLFPELNLPVVAVITSYTGSSPEDMETLVTRPIEGALAGVEGVEEISSDSRNGLSVVQASFSWNSDMDQAETDLRRQLEMYEGTLPDDADAPIVFAMDPALMPVMMISVSGPYTSDELRRLAEDEVQPQLERLLGVASASATGGLVREIRVEFDPDEVAAFGLDPSQMAQVIYAENTQEPGGTIDVGPQSFSIQASGRYRSIDDIGEVVVGMAQTADGPHPIRVRDVATIVDGFGETRQLIEVDGEPAVLLQIRKQSGENTVEVANTIHEALPEIEASTGLTLDSYADQSGFVQRSLGNLSQTALLGVAISFLVVFSILRDWRSALIVSTAIPISVIATFGLMNQAGMTLNIISMAGLALAIGMLVDNAIVVLENIFRLREEGADLWTAAIDGARGVSTAVIASTLTTLSVFIPILFVEGIAGQLFTDLAVTICFALATSLLVALTFVPLAASRSLSSSNNKATLVWLNAAYDRLLRWLLLRRWLVVVGLVVALIVTAGLATTIRTDFMSTPDQSEIELAITVPPGSSFDETVDIVHEVVDRIEEVALPTELALMSVDAGESDGVDAMFSGAGSTGGIYLQLTPPSQRERSQQEIIDALRQGFATIPGASIQFADRGPTGGSGDMDIVIRGHDLEQARLLGTDLSELLVALPEVAQVDFSLEDQQPELKVAYDRQKIGRLGLSTAKIGQALSAAFQGTVAGRYSEDGDEIDIRVRYSPENRDQLEDVWRMPVANSSGGTVPLISLADIDETLGPVSINRRDQERVTRLSVELEDSWADEDGGVHYKDLAGSISRLNAQLVDLDWPEGFDYEIGGTADDFVESFTQLGYALLVSILLVFMVMASQFESLRQPFVILFTVPLALMGVVWAFALTGWSLNVTAVIGVIMLVGIAVNNGIVLVDAANQLRSKGLDIVEAAAASAKMRFRPVLLTSLTTILSMVPLALELSEGSAQWAGMARAVIGGLVAATVLTLFVVPTIYTWLAEPDSSTGGA
ncbi:MAG: efflux RND transporter permease subunit [Proteobacteria bacterium]|nr:efflux RND transporter permease subunit [Pseudomonadota bacterium]